MFESRRLVSVLPLYRAPAFSLLSFFLSFFLSLSLSLSRTRARTHTHLQDTHGNEGGGFNQ